MDIDYHNTTKKDLAGKQGNKKSFLYVFAKNNFVVPPKNQITWAFIEGLFSEKFYYKKDL